MRPSIDPELKALLDAFAAGEVPAGVLADFLEERDGPRGNLTGMLLLLVKSRRGPGLRLTIGPDIPPDPEAAARFRQQVADLHAEYTTRSGRSA